jgi:sugar lactone lactonase YvrE
MNRNFSAQNRTAFLLLFAVIAVIASCKKSSSPSPTLSVSTNRFSLAALSNSKDTFTISSTGSWTIASNQSWLTMSVGGGTGNATIIATAAANAGNGSTRNATITVTLSGAGSDSINVTQDAGIVIVAGNGTEGSGLDQLHLPMAIALDAQNNLYVADALNYRIMEWTPGATQGSLVINSHLVVQAGGTNGSLPSSIFIDASGNKYVTEEPSGTYDLDGVVEWTAGATGSSTGNLVAGNGTDGTGLTQFWAPSGIWVDAAGNMYVSDQNNNWVVKWAPGATQGVVVAGNGTFGTSLSQVGSPEQLFLDAADDIYVADQANGTVVEWTPGATQGIIVAGSGTIGSGLNQLDWPTGVYLDKAGNIYVGDNMNNRVMKWAPGATTGVIVAGTGTVGAALNQLAYPSYVLVDASGYIYVTDPGNYRVVRWAQ